VQKWAETTGSARKGGVQIFVANVLGAGRGVSRRDKTKNLKNYGKERDDSRKRKDLNI